MLAADTDVAKRPLEEATERSTKQLVGKTSFGTKRGPVEPVEELDAAWRAFRSTMRAPSTRLCSPDEHPQNDLGDAMMTLLEILAVENKDDEEQIQFESVWQRTPRSWVITGAINTSILDFERRPVWVKDRRQHFWRKMFHCCCMYGPHACKRLALPYYGYLCRLCNVQVQGEERPRCHCRCEGCLVPAEYDPDVNWRTRLVLCDIDHDKAKPAG